LEQALKATDLLLQAGGFGAIVLDMSDVLPQHAMRIPLATWYRFRLAAEQARTALIFLSDAPCTHSCATLALRCEPASVRPFSSNGETGPERSMIGVLPSGERSVRGRAWGHFLRTSPTNTKSTTRHH